MNLGQAIPLKRGESSACDNPVHVVALAARPALNMLGNPGPPRFAGACRRATSPHSFCAGLVFKSVPATAPSDAVIPPQPRAFLFYEDTEWIESAE